MNTRRGDGSSDERVKRHPPTRPGGRKDVHTAARLLTRAKRSEHISPTLRQLHWLPVERRIVFKVVVQVFKALNNDSFPLYIRT